MQYKLSASILSANFARLGEEIDDLVDAGIDSIHLDVMDNRYVPNLTFGPCLYQSIQNHNPKAEYDIHIMAYNLESLIKSFAKYKPNSILIHPDQTPHLHKVIASISEQNIKVGVALNPATPLALIENVLTDIDQVLIMTVNPGFGGQKFINTCLSKIEQLRNIITKENHNISIMVDGGINTDTIKLVKDAGADTFVIGSALVSSEKNYKEKIQTFRECLQT